MKALHSCLIALVLFVFASRPTLAQETTRTSTCVMAVGHVSVEEVKARLLEDAKRMAVNQLFSEIITTLTTVENSVVTKDQITSSTVGIIRLDGDPVYRNGSNFAEVCVTIVAYTTPEDRKLFQPEELSGRQCLPTGNLTAKEVQKMAKDTALLEALYKYDPNLEGIATDTLFRLTQRVRYPQSNFTADATAYCATVQAQIVPIEVMALLISPPLGPDATPKPGERPVATPTASPGSQASLRVCKTDDSDYTSIQSAVDAAAENTTIQICPGIYQESITVTRTLSLIGEEGNDPVMIFASESHAIWFDAPTGKIAGLTISVAPPANNNSTFHGIVVSTGTVLIENNDIESLAGNGITVWNESSPTIRENILYNSRDIGLAVLDGSTPTVIGNSIGANGGAGISISEAFGTYEDNLITENTKAGVELRSSKATFLTNEISKNSVGFSFSESDQSSITKNNVFTNRNGGMVVWTNSNPKIVENHIYENQGYGIWVSDRGRGEIKENQISVNRSYGIMVDEYSNPYCEGNDITKNGRYGIYIEWDGGGTYLNNSLADNGEGASYIRAARDKYVWRNNHE